MVIDGAKSLLGRVFSPSTRRSSNRDGQSGVQTSRDGGERLTRSKPSWPAESLDNDLQTNATDLCARRIHRR